MKIALQIVSIIAIALGGLAVISGAIDTDGYALVGGGLFLTQGILSLLYIKSTT